MTPNAFACVLGHQDGHRSRGDLLPRTAVAHRFTKAGVEVGRRTTAIDHGAPIGIDVHSGQRPSRACEFTIISAGAPSNAASAGPCTTDASPATPHTTRNRNAVIHLATGDPTPGRRRT
ncbi:hypothetical protein AB0D86_28425 [Streptomyces sp. NPDC048324]|uniref:hypothetical protein n=1 Tax=Streptomyces sp. NPDC048324 TaxID=3157205 RepID=UPI003422AEF7